MKILFLRAALLIKPHKSHFKGSLSFFFSNDIIKLMLIFFIGKSHLRRHCFVSSDNPPQRTSPKTNNYLSIIINVYLFRILIKKRSVIKKRHYDQFFFFLSPGSVYCCYKTLHYLLYMCVKMKSLFFFFFLAGGGGGI